MSNAFSFTGTIGRDAEVRYTASGMAVLNVTVANNVGFGDKQTTLWIKVALFGKKAESKLVDYLKKGTQVFCSGELSQSEYKANDGTTRTSLELVANVLDLVGKKPDTGQAPQQRQHDTGKANAYQQQPSADNNFPYNDECPF